MADRSASTVAGVILAAGRSARLESDAPKQLLEIDGEPLVRRVARTALASRLAEVVVVLGHRSQEVGAVVTDLDLRRVVNPRYEDGQSTSLRAGLHALSPECRAALFVLADQPLLTAAAVDRLIAAWQYHDGSIVVPVCRGRRGAPVLFDRSFFDQLAELRGDAGGRQLLDRHADAIVTVEVADPDELRDVDTLEDLRGLEDSFRGAR